MQRRIDYAALARQVLAGGVTTKALGVQIGLSQPAVSRLANGRTGSLAADPAIELIYAAGGRVEMPPVKDAGGAA